MKSIVLSFTLKGQDQQAIIDAIHRVAIDHPNHILVHGFMPKEIVLEKGFSTEIVDALQRGFPVQLNMYNNGPMRQEMMEVAKQLRSKIVVIGEIKEGVAEEVELYRLTDLEILELPI